MSFLTEILEGITFEEGDLNNPTFTFGSETYSCVPSVNEFKRTLDTGGFVIDKMLTLTVRIIDKDSNALYTTVPTPQQIIAYNGENFRIESKHTHPTGAYVRFICMGVTRGV
jgi:hypothetical protein